MSLGIRTGGEREMTAGSERITIGFSATPRSVDRGADTTRGRLFAEILTAGPLSRTQLAQRSGLSQSTVTKVVNPLIEAGFVGETGEHSVGIGRPQRLLEVAADRRAAIGVKIGPGAVTGVLTDLRAQVLGQRTRPLTAGHDPSAALSAAAAVVWDLLAGHAGAREKLIGVGVGLGGHVAAADGRVVRSGVLGWTDVEVSAPLAAATGVPTVIGNDVDTLAVAERWFGAGRDVEGFALVTVGPGVGCGLFLGGELVTGVGGLAGELGHIPMQAGGRACTCGNRGCLETLASDDAVLRRIAENGGHCTGIEDAVAAAREGDARAIAAFEAMGDALGRGLATLCNLVNPGRIVLAGERAGAFDLFGEACTRAWRAHAFSTAAADCELIVDETDDSLWARGAACLVIRDAVGADQA
ncbi:ROK family transcriptional regulator [Actinospica sp.]|uniref:ROK family transcriptional regulator n=1 Tax=Actinospica sp. TaxID=1872142 RepID=UPI002C2DC23E|nr:ROK family transcriptional regulator [Actinospica sp.]HWG27213.1 ROK family transcriptional regulator [Actinospica sp.]